MSQCTAKSKRTGERCKVQAMRGRHLCYHHGGKNLIGPASPAYKTGRYSKYLPARLSQNYDAARSDPNLLALRDDISLLDSRLSDLLTRVDSGESGEAWQRAGEALAGMRLGLDSGNIAMAKAALEDLDTVIRRGLADHYVWREIGETLDRRERLVRSERRRLVEMQQVLTLQEGMILFSRIGDLIEQHVQDRAVKSAIYTGIQGLLTANPEPDQG